MRIAKTRSNPGELTPGFAIIPAELVKSGIWAKLKDRHRNVLICVLSHYPYMWPSIARLEEMSGCKRRNIIRTLNELDHIGLLIKKIRHIAKGGRGTNQYLPADLQDKAVVRDILLYLEHPQIWQVTNILYAGGMSDAVDAETLRLLSHKRGVSGTAQQGGVGSGTPGVVSGTVHMNNTSIRDKTKEHAGVDISSNAICQTNTVNQLPDLTGCTDDSVVKGNISQPFNSVDALTDTLPVDSVDSLTDSLPVETIDLPDITPVCDGVGDSFIDPVDGTKVYTRSTLKDPFPVPSPSSPMGIRTERLDYWSSVARKNNYLRTHCRDFRGYENLLKDDAGMKCENLLLATNHACDVGYSLPELKELIRDTQSKASKCPQGLLLKRLADGDRINVIEGYNESIPAHLDAKERAIKWLKEHGIVTGGQRMILKDHLMSLIKLQYYGKWADDCLEDFRRNYQLTQFTPPGVIVAEMKKHLAYHLQHLLKSAKRESGQITEPDSLDGDMPVENKLLQACKD